MGMKDAHQSGHNTWQAMCYSPMANTNDASEEVSMDSLGEAPAL